MALNKKKMAVLSAVRQAKQAINMPTLMSHLGEGFSERSVRRWLNEMVNDHLVKKIGKKRSTHYLCIPDKDSRLTETHIYPVFSASSQAIINYVRQPIFQRSPTAYQEDLLRNYLPNQSYYLPKSMRHELLQIGQRAKLNDHAGTYAHKIINRLLIDLSYNSSRLEGNTYSRLDTEKLLLEGKHVAGKLTEETIMILNHKEAIRHLVDFAHTITIDFNEICSLHYLLSDGLLPAAQSGKVRDHGVRIGESVYVPLENPQRLTLYIHEICQKASEIQDPFEQSFFLLVHIAYLQAFTDVNKRTSRLAANIPLIKHNLVPLSFNDLEKSDYISAMLALYERQNSQPLADLYYFSYKRTSQQYDVTLESFGLNTIRAQYRQQRRQLIRHIICQNLHLHSMQQVIVSYTEEHIPAQEQKDFINCVYEELAIMSIERIVGLGITKQELQNWLDSRA